MSEASSAKMSPRALIVAIGAAAAMIVTPFVAGWESGGKERLVAYRDIVGVVTICDGDTNDVRMGQTETSEGCRLRLERQLVAHAVPVKRCTPGIVDRPNMLAAAISLAYNIGPSAYCRSTVARRFNRGDLAGGCDAMLAWNRAGGRVVRGLDNRRHAERELCRKDLP